MKKVTKLSVQYANEREQFKTKIIDFEAIKQSTQMATDAYVGESACYRASKDIEDRIEMRHKSGNTFQEAELKGVEEYVVECSILKVAVSEDCQNTSDEGIQIFEDRIFSQTYSKMELASRDARIARIYEELTK